MSIFKPNSKKTTLEMTVPDEKTPMIYIETYALMKMNNYIQNCDKEISWLGVVERNDNVFLITDVMLFEQEVTGVTTEIDEGHLSSFGTKLIQTGQMDLYNKIRMWGHSHANLEVYASKTDNDTFEQFYENCEYFIRLIANKKGDIKIDFIDNERHIKYLDLDWYENKSNAQLKLEDLIAQFNKSMETLNDKIKKEITEEIKENIIYEKKTTKSSTYTTENTSDSKPPMVRVRQGNTLLLTSIANVLTDADMIYLMTHCFNYFDLSDELKSYDEFADYTLDDFRDLYSKLVAYYYNSPLYEEAKKDKKKGLGKKK